MNATEINAAGAVKTAACKQLLPVFFGLIVSNAALADVTASSAEEIVKSATCVAGQSIDTVLAQKINSSQRDLGWQVFEVDGTYTVERSILISKSMQLRYRWEVDSQGGIRPVSNRSQDLCFL